MGRDLAIDELETGLGFGDLLTEAGGQFGEQIAMFEGGGFGVEMQLGDITGEQ